MDGIRKTLALDLGTQMGWAYRVGDETHHGSIPLLDDKRFHSDGWRSTNLWRTLNEMSGVYGTPQEVFYEEVRRFSSGRAGNVFSTLQGTLQAWCIKNGVEYCSVPIMVIKKHILEGKPAKGKKSIMDAVENKYDIKVKDDNEADAIAILDYAINNYGGIHE